MDAKRRLPFGSSLRQFREAAALSQEQLAERAGLSLRGISDLERGARTRPRLETVRMIADGLALSEGERHELLDARNFTQETSRVTSGYVPPKLPEPVTLFIGREQEIRDVQRMLLHGQAKLVTLTGPGGVGKTRIAIEVAHRLANDFQDGAIFVDLSPIRHPDLVLPTLANRLGVAEHAGNDLRESLCLALQSRHLLLVLDNLEQVIDSAMDIARLLAVCPMLTIIATSRVLLRIAAEHVLPVDPMTLPTLDDLDSLQQSEAASLFVARARATDYHLKLTHENAATIAALIAHLQGMPLAIELAAARVRMLTIPELLRRLEHQLPALTGGANDAPERHRTMRDTIAWSYHLLSPTEQTVFRTLAVFPDGCSLDTAVAVLGVGDRFSEAQTLDAMESLVDSSMLRRREGLHGEVRFRMLQTVREFGLEQLEELGEENAARQAAYFAWAVPLAYEAEFRVATPNVVAWLYRIRVDYQNLREHVSWLMQHDFAEEALNISIALATCNSIRGHFEDSRQELEEILAHPHLQSATVVRMRGLIVLGNLCIHQGDPIRSIDLLHEGERFASKLQQERHIVLAFIYLGIAMFMIRRVEDAEECFTKGIVTAQALEDKYSVAAGYRLLAGVAELRGQLERSHQLLQESLDISLAQGHVWNVALAKINLGFQLVLMGELDQAEKFILDARALFDELDSPRELPLVLYTLADIARLRQNLPDAEKLLEEALAIARDIGGMRAIAPILLRLGRVSLLKGDEKSAQSFTCDAVDWFERCGDVGEAVNWLGLAADTALVRGDVVRAVWCIGAVDSLSAEHGVNLLLVDAGDRRRRIDAVMQLVDEREWHKHYNRAFAMSDKEILAEVRLWQECR